MKKKLMSLFLAFVMCIMPFSVALASGDYGIEIPDNIDFGGMGAIAGTIIGAMKFIGYVVAVVMIIFVGIKYLMAGAGEKAAVKSTLVPMLAGALLIIFGVTIVDWVFNLG